MGKCGSVPEEEDTSPQEQQLQQIAVTVNGVNKNDTPKHSSTNGTQAPQTQPSSTSPTPQPATTDAPISQPTQSTQQHLSPQPISPQKDSVISTQVTFHSTHESPSHHSQPPSHSNIPIDIKMDATEIAKTLKNVPLLSKLTDPERESLSKALSVRTFQDSQRIVSQGEQGNEFFIIKEGTARVTRLISETNKEVELCFLKKGDYFGEKALLKNTPREATIQAVGPITCFSLDQKKFREMFGSDRLNVTFAKRAAVSAEAYNRENEHKIVHAPPNANRRKTSDQKSMIMGVVRNNILFQNLNPEQQGQVVDTMWLMDVKAGTSVIKQGEPGDNWYVVDHGVFDIYVLKENKQNKVATRGVGTSFGELALMYNSPRAATVTAVVDSSVWAVDRWTFRRILTDASDARLKEYETFLQGVQSFEVLLDYERSKIAEALEEVSYPAGHAIVRQGEQGDTFFILKRGHVVCTVQSKDGVKEVARYKPGDYFGERALVRKEERAATCTAVDDCVCLYLNREAFSLLLGPMEDIFQQRVEGYNLALDPTNTQKRPRTSSAASLSQQPIQQDENFLMTDIKLKDLKVIGTLGKGSFGHVQLVRDERTRQTYALKVVSKAQIVQLGQQEHIMSEKRVMASLNSNFLIRLYATFKDKNCLYFLLEPSLGGELFSVLRAKTFFDEHTARFFAAGVVLAFEYMHARGIIYRDLKPENLLLDSKGYLKITDFGFAKKVGDQRTWTLCGTPDYLAPEVVSGQGHGKGVDWWTLGILIYEMLASYPPFYDEDPMKTYAKIMHGQVAFPMHFSKPAIDLIKRLLHAKATKRLGVVAGGAKLVREHVWFSGFDWEAFEQRRMPAPIVLPVKDAEDLSNFEEYPDEENQWEEYTGDPKNPDWDKDF